MKCYKCDGIGENIALVTRDRRGELCRVKCCYCDGTGDMPPHIDGWIRRGEAIREARLARGETLRSVAVRLGMSAADYSAMESGRRDPSPIEEVA